jgi:hypothetical protein
MIGLLQTGRGPMRCVIVVAMAALVSSAVTAHAQAVAPQERISTAMARAKQVGIPVALLESKIAEGRAKGVSQERLAAAIERRLAALERASQAFRGGTDTADSLGLGADAIEAGVSEAVLRALAESAPRDRRNVAIAALTELVHQGQGPEVALGRVQDALRRGPDALSNLPGESSGRGSGRSDVQDRGNSGNSNSGVGNSGRSNSGSGAGNSGRGRGVGASPGADAGPPAAVPAPGQGSQAGRPDNPGRGSDGSSGNSGGGNPGRGNSGGGNSGGGGGGGGTPGRGNQ